MTPLPISQKQEIYEHLLTLDCPDLLAALIAERSTRYTRCIDATIYDVIADNFSWPHAPEEDGFWSEIYADTVEQKYSASDTSMKERMK